MGSWITNAATAIAGPPAAFIGQASENVSEVIDGVGSSEEEEKEMNEAVRRERRRQRE